MSTSVLFLTCVALGYAFGGFFGATGDPDVSKKELLGYVAAILVLISIVVWVCLLAVGSR